MQTGADSTLQVALLSGRSRDALLTGDVVVFLPGGPGLSARSSLQSSYPRAVDLRNTTLITWDGITHSDRRGACGPLSTTYGGAPQANQTPGQRRGVYLECVTGSGGGAREAADELEVVREALGLSAVKILSYSYGTEIATAYAERFPGMVDRVVLDGPLLGHVPFSARLRAVRSAISAGYSSWLRSCRDRWCSAPVARLFDDAKSWSSIRAVLARREPRIGSTNQVLTPDLMDRAALFMLTRPTVREEFAAAVESALAGQGSELYAMSLRPYFGLDRATYYRAMCQDVEFPAKLPELPAYGLQPILQAFVDDLSPCIGTWADGGAANTSVLKPAVAQRMVVVASVQDPLTPWGLVGASVLPGQVRRCRIDTPGHTGASSEAVVSAELRFLRGAALKCP